MNLDELVEQSSRREISDFKKSLGRYLKKWPWMLLGLFIAVSIVSYYLRTISPKYKITSKVEIVKSQAFNDPTEILFGNRFGGNGRFKPITDETVIFKSYPLVEQVVKSKELYVNYYQKSGLRKVELYSNRPFIIAPINEDTYEVLLNKKLEIKLVNKDALEFVIFDSNDEELLKQKTFFDEKIDFNNHSFYFKKTDRFNEFANYEEKYTIMVSSIESIARRMQSMLEFEDSDLLNILVLKMTSSTPDKAIAFMDGIIEEYIEQNLKEKNEVSRKTVEFIDSQLAEITDSLSLKEKSLDDFKSSGRIATVSMEGQSLMEKYSELESEKARYEIVQEYYDYLQSNLKDGSGKKIEQLIAPSAFGIQDLVINQLVANLLDINFTLSNLEQVESTQSPIYSQLKAQKVELIKRLNESVENLVKGNKILLNNLNQRSDEISENARKLPIAERKLINLNRSLKLNENIYLFLMEKRSSAAIAMSSSTSDCKIIEPPMLNPLRPISPNKRMVYLIGCFLGLLLPLLFFIGRELLNDTIQSKAAVESATQIPIIGSIPKSEAGNSAMAVFERPKSAVAEAFRTVRSNLSFFQGTKSPFVILVTSSVAKEGKTYCAINLASILASSGKRTVILGLDLRKPQLHNYMNTENGVGVSNYLSGRAKLEEILLQTSIDNLVLVNSGSIPPNPAELLMTERTNQLINELKERFDYIIIDTPPVGVVSDALILKNYADASLYVIRQDYSKNEFLNSLDDLSKTNGMKNLSILMNDVSISKSRGYGYYEDRPTTLIERIKHRFNKP